MASLSAASQTSEMMPEQSAPVDSVRAELAKLAETGAQRDVARLIPNGWEQRSVLDADTLRALVDTQLLFRHPTSADCVGVIITQSCDVVNGSYVTEPEVELWLVTPVEAPDAQFFALKNPRRLHLEAERPTKTCYLDVHGHMRASIPRWALEVIRPSSEIRLTRPNVKLLVDFLVNRYQRPAFPNAFNRRCRSAHRKIEQVLKRHSKEIYRLYVKLNSFDELEDGVSYVVELFVLVSQELFANPRVLKTLDQAAAKLAKELEGCDDIEVENFHVVPDISVRLSDLRRWTPWDAAEFSVGEEPAPPVSTILDAT